MSPAELARRGIAMPDAPVGGSREQAPRREALVAVLKDGAACSPAMDTTGERMLGFRQRVAHGTPKAAELYL